jgi:hypothetical protein
MTLSDGKMMNKIPVSMGTEKIRRFGQKNSFAWNLQFFDENNEIIGDIGGKETPLWS